MVDSETSGVMFTVDPISQDRGRMLIEGAYGLGEVVVGGQVEPDTYFVSRSRDPSAAEVGLSSARIGSKAYKIVHQSDGSEARLEVPQAERELRLLDDAQVLELASLGLRIEEHYGSPQDVEWAFENGKAYVLQSRPITTLEVEAGTPLVSGLGASPGRVAGKVRVELSGQQIYKWNRHDQTTEVEVQDQPPHGKGSSIQPAPHGRTQLPIVRNHPGPTRLHDPAETSAVEWHCWHTFEVLICDADLPAIAVTLWQLKHVPLTFV